MKHSLGRRATPRPFLKWAGGKGQLLPDLLERVRAAQPFQRYHEPFVGGGALFFDLYRRRMLGRKQAFLSDSSPHLIETYCGVRDDVETVISLLEQHEAQHSEDYYYQVRADVPSDPIARAARIIYLNKTCYNGLFRVNTKGAFNVPFGRYKNPMICDADNLRAVAEALRKPKVELRHFESVLDRAKPGDLVYFDPPYDPVSETASFSAYDKAGFGHDSQYRLSIVFAELARRAVHVLLSNSYTDRVLSLYEGFTIDEVKANRAVNSRGDRRGKVSEALVRSF
ncbi:MAG TPA: DNA adenine methylase [Candidatus Hydrogenedentes bacterium]|nr:DNA adenine methylase [Candidatus Hydrogenedentota bacterium]HIJ74995.1 DNA adenine methylase [Candidatus Hydrogenedentota bacterium]